MNDHNENIVKITMFKAFTIKYNGLLLKEEDMRSERILSLLCYLIYHCHRDVTTQELIDKLSYFEDVEKPIGALKNIVYRLRIVLRKHLHISDFIVTGQSSYRINECYCLDVDTEEFEKIAHQLENDSQINDFQECLALYKGKFLPSLENHHLFMAKGTYYHSLYVSTALKYCYMLDKQEEYELMEDIARTVVKVEKYEEKLYYYLILSMYKRHDYRNAINSYKTITDFLYDTLGVRPSTELAELYLAIKEESQSEMTHINDIQNEIIKETRGAFLCDYGIFKDLYNLQSRTMKRLHISSQLCLITLQDKAFQEDVMSAFEKDLVTYLRKGDVISRLSANQFIILLPNCNIENAQKVMQRVLSSFEKQVDYQLSFQEVTAK